MSAGPVAPVTEAARNESMEIERQATATPAPWRWGDGDVDFESLEDLEHVALGVED